MKLCPVSHKRKYRTKVEALIRNADRTLMSRAYRCPDCGFWHITRKHKSKAA